MKTLQEQYNLIQEGKGRKDLFGLKSSDVNCTKGFKVTTPPKFSLILLLLFRIFVASL